jgi:hypothetical protein
VRRLPAGVLRCAVHGSAGGRAVPDVAVTFDGPCALLFLDGLQGPWNVMTPARP